MSCVDLAASLADVALYSCCTKSVSRLRQPVLGWTGSTYSVPEALELFLLFSTAAQKFIAKTPLVRDDRLPILPAQFHRRIVALFKPTEKAMYSGDMFFF